MSLFSSEPMVIAAEELAPAVSGAATWMAPPDQRNFLDAGMLQALALVLISAFLAGLQEQAVKEAKDAGISVAKWLAQQIRRLFEGEPAALDEIEAQAEEGAKSADKAAADASQQLIVTVLVESMPEAEARRLAAAVRAAVESHLTQS